MVHGIVQQTEKQKKQSFWNTLRRSFKERMAYRLYIQRG